MSIKQTNDGGYIVAGNSASEDGDLSANHGKTDLWVVKLSNEMVGTETAATGSSHLEIYPNPASQFIHIKTVSGETFVTVCIMDILGRNVIERIMPEAGSLDISSLKNGFYQLLVTTNSGKAFSGKIRKQG